MTPTEKDAMALATIQSEADEIRLCGGEMFAANLEEARAHLASRIAELEAERDEFAERSGKMAHNYIEQRERANRAEAELAAVREDAERYRFLRDMKCNHFHLTLNADHAVNYMPARQWINEFAEWYEDETEEEKEAMAATNTIWCLQVYPDTPNGFYVWNRATLDAAIDAARGGE